MDLIQLIIGLLGKAFETPKPRGPTAGNPNDLVRQIQARIEAARQQNPQARQPAGSGPLRAQLPPPGRPKPRTAKQRKPKRSAPPALPIAVAPAATPKAAVPTAPPLPPPKPAVINVDAKVLARWLRPQTLRSQFILTEIFQPPLALRDSHPNL
jgi:hypothetical protein